MDTQQAIRRSAAIGAAARAAILLTISMAGSACGAATNPTVTAQITRLQAGGESLEAIRNLAAMGPEAIEAAPALIAFARDDGSDSYTRSEALSALGEIGAKSPDAIKVLFEALEPSRGTSEGFSAALSLGMVGHGNTEIEDRLREVAAGRGEPFVREGAILALGYMGARDEKTEAVLLEALAHPEDFVKRSVACALWQLSVHGPDTLEGVKRHFNTTSEAWFEASRNVIFPSPAERQAVSSLESLQEELLVAVALLNDEPADTGRFLRDIPPKYMSGKAKLISQLLLEDLENGSPFVSGVRVGLGERFTHPMPVQHIGTALNSYISALLSKDNSRLREAAAELARTPRSTTAGEAARKILLERQTLHLREEVTGEETELEGPSDLYLLRKLLGTGAVIVYTKVEGTYYAMGPEGTVYSHRAIEEATSPLLAWDERLNLGFLLEEVSW